MKTITKTYCPQCKKYIDSGAFCGVCGTKLIVFDTKVAKSVDRTGRRQKKLMTIGTVLLETYAVLAALMSLFSLNEISDSRRGGVILSGFLLPSVIVICVLYIGVACFALIVKSFIPLLCSVIMAVIPPIFWLLICGVKNGSIHGMILLTIIAAGTIFCRAALMVCPFLIAAIVILIIDRAKSSVYPVSAG